MNDLITFHLIESGCHQEELVSVSYKKKDLISVLKEYPAPEKLFPMIRYWDPEAPNDEIEMGELLLFSLLDIYNESDSKSVSYYLQLVRTYWLMNGCPLCEEHKQVHESLLRTFALGGEPNYMLHICYPTICHVERS